MTAVVKAVLNFVSLPAKARPSPALLFSLGLPLRSKTASLISKLEVKLAITKFMAHDVSLFIFELISMCESGAAKR